jgi:hypothetical protein
MFGFDDDEIAALYDRMQSEFELDARKEAMWELQRAALRYHGPVLHMFDGYGYSLWHPWVHNWRPENTELNWYNSEIWLSERS